MRKSYLIFVISGILLLGFVQTVLSHGHKATVAPAGNTDTFFTSTFTVAQLNYSNAFVPAVKTGEINDTNLREASGITASRTYKKLYWTHNDGGNPNDIFLIDEQGHEKAIVTLKGCENRDWEDIATGPGPEKNEHYLYISETGDNHFKYNTYCLYRLKEPKIKPEQNKVIKTVATADKITFVYPDGPHNAEALIIDPATKDIYIITKSKLKAEAFVYQMGYSQAIADSIITLRKIGVLPIIKVTSATISPDGNEILVKNIEHVFYWKRKPGATIAATLTQTPRLLPYKPEPQGEAICFTPDGKYFMTLSEKKDSTIQAVYTYKRK